MATELSEQTNTKTCDLEGLTDVWVRFKAHGYPFKLRREWDASDGAQTTLGIVLRFVEAWNVKDVDGNVIELSTDAACLDNVEDAFIGWLVRTFQVFWLVEVSSAKKN